MNDPRRELAAYHIQQLFLDPSDYVVPPTAAVCFPLRTFRERVDRGAVPGIAGLECAFGVVSYWLADAQSLDGAEDEDLISTGDGTIDAKRFQEDAQYRSAVSDLNLLTYLIEHGDSHADQFVVQGGRRLRIYSVDNSIALSSFRNPTLDDDQNWARILVPQLPRSRLERLFTLTPERLQRLAVLAEYRLVGDRLAAEEVTSAPGGDLEAPLRWSERKLQLGLTRQEIDRVWARLQALRRRVERGQPQVF